MFLIGFLFSHGTSSFFDYGKGRQHFWLSPLDYPPARTVGAVNGGRSSQPIYLPLTGSAGFATFHQVVPQKRIAPQTFCRVQYIKLEPI